MEKALRLARRGEEGGNRPLTGEVAKILQAWYRANISDPYLNREEAQELADRCGIKVTQVRKWLANKRLRSGNTSRVNGSKMCKSHKYHSGKQ